MAWHDLTQYQLYTAYCPGSEVRVPAACHHDWPSSRCFFLVVAFFVCVDTVTFDTHPFSIQASTTILVPTALKTGLVFLAQLHLTWAMVLGRRQQVSCSYSSVATSGLTCQSFSTNWGLTDF